MNKLKKIISSIVILSGVLLNLCAYAESNEAVATVNSNNTVYNQGVLYINGNKIETEDTLMYRDDDILFPMRRIFEKIGAKVNWDDVEKHTIIEYKGEKYICTIAPVNQSFPDVKAITFQNIKNLGKKESSTYIQLNPMGVSGSFRIINDYTYLYQETAEYLFSAFDCKIEVDTNNKTVYISSLN